MSAPLIKPARRGPKPPKRLPRASRPIARSSSPILRRKRVNRASRHAEQRRIDDAEWSRAVRDEAYGLCELCRWRGEFEPGTDAHHVMGKKANPKLRYVLANGVFLSRACHRFAHSYPVAFRGRFAERRPESWRELLDRRGLAVKPTSSNPGDEDSRAPMKGRAE